ncbi:MAG: CZB domain-containing protein [Thiomonas sp.]|uniref:CZB domain-containing protein n=1 Tax=Thiomonas sp. TaxID=2047785 RepID=UPI002A36CE5F|nr:CZB domain-containing protein [Thiomonas sp.]MDY0328995.1 CZB domain-containing protein [Thiomonas sp.]
MKWFDGLRKQAGAEPQAPRAGAEQAAASLAEVEGPGVPLPEPAQADGELAGLDFYSAIATHQRWKNRFKSVIRGESDEPCDAAVVARTDACLLGKWLATQHGDARIPDDLLSRLEQEHATFHQLAAEVVRLSDRGLHEQALAALRTDAPYNRCSHRLTRLLSQIHLQLSELHQPGARS